MVFEELEDFRDSVRLVLEANGYIMAEAASAEDGLKVYKESSPDFILIDLMMEEIDAGTSFVKELQARGNKAPVYMLSSVGSTLSQTVDTAGLGLDGVFQKPLDTDALLNVLKTKLK